MTTKFTQTPNQHNRSAGHQRDVGTKAVAQNREWWPVDEDDDPQGNEATENEAVQDDDDEDFQEQPFPEDEDEDDEDEDDQDDDCDDDDAEEEEEVDDDDEAEAEPEYEDDDLSVPQLASAIRESYTRCQRHHQKAAEHALRTGELLLRAKELIPRGEWTKWLSHEIEMTPRTAQRFCRLVRVKPQLDEILPDWQSTYWPSEALELLAEPRVKIAEPADEVTMEDDASVDDEDEEYPDEQHDDEEGEGDDEEMEEDDLSSAAPTTARDLRQAKQVYRESLKQLPRFQDAAGWKFRRNSPEQAALTELSAAVVQAARKAARALRTAELAEEFSPDVFAMALVSALLDTGKVEQLFRPTA